MSSTSLAERTEPRVLLPRLGRGPTVVFLHLPRTAGTTLNTIIERQYDRASIYTFGGRKGPRLEATVDGFNARSPAERARFAVVRGHVPFGVHELIDGPSAYVTIVRDPVERVISYYYYIRRQPIHHLHDTVVSGGLSLLDCLRGGLSNQFNNGQTRLLCGGEVARTAGYGQAPRELLETAKTNLRERFAIVGITERFDETLLLLQRALLWGTPLYVRANVTEGRPSLASIDPATLRAVEEYNHLDVELYAYARSHFDEQVAAAGDSFAGELRTFRLLNHLETTVRGSR